MSAGKCWVIAGLFVILTCGSASAISITDALRRAESGDHNAQSYLGYLFLCGKIVEKDAEKARYWYERVLEQPNADAKIVAHAKLILGMLYRSGKGGVQCYKTAMDCFLAAAKQGYTDAHINIGLLYAQGLGVEKDYDKALYWWSLAAEKGHPRASLYVASLKKTPPAILKGGGVISKVH
jgi:hypothetical protein